MAKEKKLSTRQKKFVAAVTLGEKTTEEAAREAGYAANTRAQLETSAGRLLARPQIQKAIATLIAEKYPDVDSQIAQGFKQTFDGFLSGDVKFAEWIKAVQEYAKITGQHAPTKSASLKVDMKDFKKWD